MFFFFFFEDLCKKNNTTPAKVAKDLGLSNATTTKWKKGATPQGKTLAKVADYFDVSTDYLLGKTDVPTPSKTNGISDIPKSDLIEDKKEKSANNDGLSENRRKLIQFAETVPDDKAELVLRVMKSILESD